MATYSVEYTGRNLPTNLDALACGLRVLREGEYFQYFMPVVSGPSLLSARRAEDDRWWPALVAVGIEAIKEAVNADFHPQADPGQAFHLPVAASDVERRVSSEVTLPQLTDGLFGGHHVESFEGP